jgi:hypothetical protein
MGLSVRGHEVALRLTFGVQRAWAGLSECSNQVEPHKAELKLSPTNDGANTCRRQGRDLSQRLPPH